MEEKQRKRLFRSQKILLQEKDIKINKARSLVDLRVNEYYAALNLIAEELGVPKDELARWKLSEDREAIEQMPEDKPDNEEKK